LMDYKRFKDVVEVLKELEGARSLRYAAETKKRK